MKSKPLFSSDRGFGQLSLSKSFPIKPLSSDSNNEEGKIKLLKKNPSISLSEFLNRKVTSNSNPSKTIQNKQKPFLGIEGKVGNKRGISEGDTVVLDESVFKQFNHSKKEIEREVEECREVDGGSEPEGSTEPDLTKPCNPFCVSSKGGDERTTTPTPKHLVVLGDDPKPKQKQREEIFTRNKKQRPLYNHYANGSGWWDCDMEGVDNEEVGCNETGEGMGSTTLGGLDWH
ncbi:hypothetical protein C5167_043343 [Papaver somniferum]|uniref:Uncharacterized protein n=1 Tax=Papaver somniferum TaxID=3469 RepID=A0A4Y7L8U5_PAPSO|nr:hypothetical protein C5167_043343 [Papaver somniferum]